MLLKHKHTKDLNLCTYSLLHWWSCATKMFLELMYRNVDILCKYDNLIVDYMKLFSFLWVTCYNLNPSDQFHYMLSSLIHHWITYNLDFTWQGMHLQLYTTVYCLEHHIITSIKSSCFVMSGASVWCFMIVNCTSPSKDL